MADIISTVLAVGGVGIVVYIFMQKRAEKRRKEKIKLALDKARLKGVKYRKEIEAGLEKVNQMRREYEEAKRRAALNQDDSDTKS